MTPEELAAHEARHQPTRRGAVCRTCEGLWPCASWQTAAALREAWDGNDRLGAMVEWLAEVIVDARDACQRAESIEPTGSPEWVESGIAMRTTVLREVRAILDRERNAHQFGLSTRSAVAGNGEFAERAEKAEAAIARVRALCDESRVAISAGFVVTDEFRANVERDFAGLMREHLGPGYVDDFYVNEAGPFAAACLYFVDLALRGEA